MKVNKDKTSFFKFNMAYPLHTWYPLFSQGKVDTDKNMVFNNIDINNIENRALYFHIPFCEERFCAFCSFNRKLKESDLEIQNYVDSLIKEIEIKSQFESMTKIPIKAIFFGGGTPSVLSAKQILELGKVISKCFDLSQLKEFSFENNICSITEEKLLALKEIGVTNVRAGIQTLNTKYREYFNLRPTLYDINSKIELLNRYFENVCIDIIYGINGQSVDELIRDINDACKLDTKLIDFYPLTQPKGNSQLYKLFSEKGLEPHTELTLKGYKSLLREVTRQYGYIPHNGHGFVNNKYISDMNEQNFITKDYVFEYHKCVMGYECGDVIGFGSGAVSGFSNYVMVNESNIEKYKKDLMEGRIPTNIFYTNKESNSAKGIISHLPYFGYADKKHINYSNLPEETKKSLKNLIEAGLIIETENEYIITSQAWIWDNEIMYYLTPESAKVELNSSFTNKLSDKYYDVCEF